MPNYSLLPRDTLALLSMRAQKGMDIRDYVNWAGNALVDGFDSPSLAILAGLDYGVKSEIEAPEYFLKAVKELNLPIPDSELAWGDWNRTDALYRKLGLVLPDKATLFYQHLDELAEQIREGVTDPVTGLNRIYNEIVITYLFGSKEYAGTDLWKWEEVDLMKWDELRDSVYYGESYKKRNDPSQKGKEIIAFASQWLEKPKARRVPDIAASEPIDIQGGKAETIPKQSTSGIETDKTYGKDSIKAAVVRTLSYKGITRKKPDIVVENAYLQIKKRILVEVILAIFTTACTILFLSSIFFFTFNFITGGEKVSVWTILGGLFATFLLGFISMGNIYSIWFDISRLAGRKEWIKNAIRVQAEIVDRKADYNDYAESREELWSCEIKIRYPANLDDHLVELTVRAKVSDNIYFMHENQNAIPIYVSKSNPFCFLFEGE